MNWVVLRAVAATLPPWGEKSARWENRERRKDRSLCLWGSVPTWDHPSFHWYKGGEASRMLANFFFFLRELTAFPSNTPYSLGSAVFELFHFYVSFHCYYRNTGQKLFKGRPVSPGSQPWRDWVPHGGNTMAPSVTEGKRWRLVHVVANRKQRLRPEQRRLWPSKTTGAYFCQSGLAS